MKLNIEKYLIPTNLTWEEKNPINYLYRPSEAIFKLEKRLNKLQGKNKPKEE